MKNVVSTIIVFSIVIIVIIGGAYLFQSMDGVNTINGLDDKIVADIGKVMDKNDNFSKDDLSGEDNVSISDNVSDNVSKNLVEPLSRSEADNASSAMAGKTDNAPVSEPRQVNVTESISNFFKGTKIEEIAKNIANKLKILLMAAGLSSGKTDALGVIQGFLPEDSLALDNETMDIILNNPTLKKLFESEGITLDRENVEKILNDKNVQGYLKTGNLSPEDNASANKLLDNETLRELAIGDGGNGK